MMDLFSRTGEFDLSNIEGGQLLTDLIEDGVYTAFEQFDDPASEITGVAIFDIVTVCYEGCLYHLERKHDGLNAGLPHIADYVERCFIYRNLDDAEKKRRELIDEFLNISN